MAVQLNHTIVAAADAETSARWLAELLGLPEPEPFGHFWQVTAANGLGLDFASVGLDPIASQHYAFLISEEEFDLIFGRVRDRGLQYWADPYRKRPGEISCNDGGRGIYFEDPDGHFLELLTRPYGSGK